MSVSLEPVVRRALLRLLLCGLLGAGAAAQTNRIDVVNPNAPELAAYGPLAIGVRTLTVTDQHRIDILCIAACALQRLPGGGDAHFSKD